MSKRKRKVLVIGKVRIRLPQIPDIKRFGVNGISKFFKKIPSGFMNFIRHKVKIGGKNIPAALFVALAIAILAVLIVYGQSIQNAAGNLSPTNPYGEPAAAYNETGVRISADTASSADTMHFWNIMVNGHKHATLEEWQNCPNNLDDDPQNDDAPPPVNTDGTLADTFTIAVEGNNVAPAWLREVSEGAEKPSLKTETPVVINRGGGLYGADSESTKGPAYLKLFYVNSEAVWSDFVDYEGSPFKTPFGDMRAGHKASKEHPVGVYDPLFTNAKMTESETNAVLYAPNTKYQNYLTPVAISDIKKIELTETGFEIEINSNAILGKTLAVAWMTELAADTAGAYNSDVGYTVTIGGKVAGTLSVVAPEGEELINTDKGKFVIEQYDLETSMPIPDVEYTIVASSEDGTLADSANAVLAGTTVPASDAGADADTDTAAVSKKNITGASGSLAIDLPALPWAGGKNLKLTITEKAPETHIGVQQFTIELEPQNGTIISMETAQGDVKFIRRMPGKYGVYIWNKSVVSDTEFYDAALRTWIKKVDRGQSNIFYDENPNTDVVPVENGDVILYRIDVYNQCLRDIVIPEIMFQLPAGLKFSAETTIAHIDPAQPAYTNSEWMLIAGTDGTPDMLKYVGDPIRLYPWDGAMANYPEFRIPLVLTVEVAEDVSDGTILTSLAEIAVLQDFNEGGVTDVDSTPDSDLKNDGAVPDIVYETAPEGAVVSCDIEGHRRYDDGQTDISQDEDDHDYASVKFIVTLNSLKN